MTSALGLNCFLSVGKWQVWNPRPNYSLLHIPVPGVTEERAGTSHHPLISYSWLFILKTEKKSICKPQSLSRASWGGPWSVSQPGERTLRRHEPLSASLNKPFLPLELLKQWQEQKPKQKTPKVYQIKCVQLSKRKNIKHGKHMRLGSNVKKLSFQLCICIHVFVVAR